jgi:murein L,D-transpeptidase YcbB/YkuD
MSGQESKGGARVGRIFLTGLLIALLGAAGARGEEPVPATEIPVREAPQAAADLDRWAARTDGWTPQAVGDLAGYLFEAPSHGLPSLDTAAEILLDDTRPFAARAALAARSALQYMAWLEYGLIDSETLAPRVLSDAEVSPLVERLNAALERGRVGEAIAASQPVVRDYDILRGEMLRMLAVRPIWPQIDPGPSLSPGDEGERVDQLRARLTAQGLLAPGWRAGDPYDMRLETAVRRYQGRVNLSPTGRLDRPTLRQLNITPQDRIAQLRANLEQRRWRTRRLGYRHIWVNLADFHLEAWEDGRLAREHEVMIGGQASSTPEFSEEMQYIVLNPWWGLPAGSARSRFRSIRRNPGIVNSHGFRIYNSAGEAISVYEIDWSRWNNGWPYRLSQPPGPTNPMGEVKFIFPNRYNVYIHDTTERDRFVRTRRDFSAGCIRVQDPLALAEWVLDGQADWSRERIDAVVSGNDPTVVWLDRRIPVHIAYWTVVGDTDGTVRYLHDLYRRDGAVMAAYARAWRDFSAGDVALAGGEGAPLASLRR